MKRLKGSLTVFFALVMVSIMALFFSLAELLRYKTLTEQADIISTRAAENFMAKYQREMFGAYGILGRDTGCGGTDSDMPSLCNEIIADLSENGNPPEDGMSLIRLSPESCEIVNYGFYTDDNGAPFIKAGVRRVVEEIPEIMLESFRTDGDTARDAFLNGYDADALMAGGESGMAEADAIKAELEKPPSPGEEGNRPAIPEKSAEVIAAEEKYAGVENPITTVKSCGADILSLVVPRGMTISDKAVDMGQMPSHRLILNHGNRSPRETAGPTDMLLFDQYILTDFQRVGHDMQQPGLKYAVEYIICGNATDRENLKGVADWLLAFRETENIAAIVKDGGKMSEAYTFALAIVGWTGNPAIVESVKWGIIAAWAMVESVLDIRTLLSGGKVPVLKSPADWTSSIMNLGTLLSGDAKAKDCPSGISYENYLRMMLVFLSPRDAAFRTMDMVESAVRTKPEYADLRMENVLYAGDISMTVVGSPVFMTFVPGGDRVLPYTFIRERQTDYL